MDFKGLQDELTAFAQARNWEPFHTPKNLSMALMVEAAELMELFQWKTPEESHAAEFDQSLQLRIGEELADVLLYLVQLAAHTGVDLEQAVADKLLKNAKKHPIPGEPITVAPQDTKPAQTHVLIDWENVQPKEADIRRLVPDVTHVWIFHGPQQKRVGDNQKSFGESLTLVPISRAGKNALDFHLSYYVGYISSRSPHARFVVISNDQGYGPMLEHASELGFAASQVGFGPAKSAAKPAAKKTAAKKAPAKKAAAVKAPAPATSTPQTTKPTKTAVAKKAAKPASKKVTPKVSAAVETKKTAPAAKKATSSKAKTKQTQPKTSSTAASPTGPVNVLTVVGDDAKAYAHVLASLRKSKNKPTRKARLIGAVKSLLGAEKADDAAVARVVQSLIDDGHLLIDAKGAVTKTP
jgi:NTP pyrophosphatase (non-canonical NTP hydrolase)